MEGYVFRQLRDVPGLLGMFTFKIELLTRLGHVIIHRVQASNRFNKRI